MKQAKAMHKLKACYELGTEQLVASGQLTQEDAEKWRAVDAKLLCMQENTKELLWFGKRRITRDYASSPEGFGKQPKSD